MSMGTLLVGIDHSPGSKMALERARSLAKTTGARLVLCTVIADRAPDELIDDARAELERLAPEADVVVRVGKPFVEIIRAAREEDAGLIVVGATGQHTEGPLALGVTVDRLARKADRPVLLVRGSGSAPYRSILVGLDGSEDSRRAARTARELAPEAVVTGVMAAPVIGETRLLLSGFQDQAMDAYRERVLEDARGELAELIGDLPIDDHQAVLGRPEAVLLEMATKLGAQLIAVGRHGRSPMASVLLGSVSHHVVQEGPCDVLVHRSPDLHFELP